METALDALPAQPLTAEDVATLNESATVRLIPYTWYGEQVIAVLLLHDTRDQRDGTAIEDATEKLGNEVTGDGSAGTDDESSGAKSAATDGKKTEFGTRESSTVGTVELLEDDSLAPDAAAEAKDEPDNADETEHAESEGNSRTDSETAEVLHVYAAGYDDSEAAWVVIAEIDPETEFTDAEPLIRDWISDTYHDQIVDKLAVGPSEYDLDGD